MASVNKVILVGNLGKDPEVRFTQGGQGVANFSIATTDVWRDKDNQKQERTEWHRIVAWGKLAELVKEYLRKGSPVYIEGRIQTRSWQDQQGQTRYTTEIVANTIQFLSQRDSRDSSAAYSQAPASSDFKPAEANRGEAGELHSAEFHSIDEDVPF